MRKTNSSPHEKVVGPTDVLVYGVCEYCIGNSLFVGAATGFGTTSIV